MIHDYNYFLISCQISNRIHVVFPSGSALDLNFSDINVASLEKELEEQDNNVGLASKLTVKPSFHCTVSCFTV